MPLQNDILDAIARSRRVNQVRQNPGMLSRFGRALDAPGRGIRSALTGVPDSSGADVLQHLFGMQNKRGEFDAADIPAFLTEVVTDPLMLVGGAGTLTKAGVQAKRLKKLDALLKARIKTRASARLGGAEDIAKVMSQQIKQDAATAHALRASLRRSGAPAQYGGSFAEQAARKQRAALTVGLPFGPQMPIVSGEGAFRLLDRIAPSIKGSAPVQALGKAFVPNFGQPEAIKPYLQIQKQLTRRAVLNAGEGADKWAKALAEAPGAADDPAALARAREALGASKQIDDEMAALRAKRDNELLEVNEQMAAQRQAQLEVMAERLRARAGKQTARLDERAKIAGRTDPVEAILAGERGRVATVGAARKDRQLQRRLRSQLAREVKRTELAGKAPGVVAGRVGRLETRLDQIIGRNMQKGRKALASGDREAARQAAIAERALGIRGNRAERLKGLSEKHLQRTEERVQEMLERGLTSQQHRRLVKKQSKIVEGYRSQFDKLNAGKDEALAALDAVDKDTLALAAAARAELQSILKREIAAGARNPTNELSAITKTYMERILTREAREMLERNPEVFNEFTTALSREFATGTPSQIARKKKYLEKFTADVDIDEIITGMDSVVQDFFSKLPDNVRPDRWFELDLSKSLPQRLLSGEVSIINAVLSASIADNFGKAGLGLGRMPLSELFTATGLRRYKNLPLGGSKETIANALKRAGLDEHSIPVEIGRELTRASQKISGPGEILALGRLFDRVTGAIKYSLTIPFPAFHARNLFSDTMLNWLAGAADPGQVLEALKVATGKNPKLLREMQEMGVLRGMHVSQISKMAGGSAADEALGRVSKTLSPKNVFEKLDQNKTYQGLTQFSEAYSRAWHYLSRRAQGYAPQEAADSVLAHLFDYSALTATERVANRGLLFYNWSRKILPRLLEDTITNPRKVAALMRATTAPTATREGPLPPHLRESAAIPYGRDEQGSQVYIGGIGSPFEELNKFDPTSPEGGFLGGVRQISRKIGQQLNPILKTPAEFATGKDLFLDQPIMELDRAGPEHLLPGLREALSVEEQTTKSGAKRMRGDPLALFLARQPPIGRTLRTVGQFMDAMSEAFGGDLDPRQGAGRALTQALTGVKVSTVDEVDRARALERILQERLTQAQREGKARTFTIPFATTKGEGDVSVESILEALRVAQEARREATEQAR